VRDWPRTTSAIAIRYKKDAEAIEVEARAKEAQSAAEERRALWLDVGEGLLELALVLSSLYFLSKRRFFRSSVPLLRSLGLPSVSRDS